MCMSVYVCIHVYECVCMYVNVCICVSGVYVCVLCVCMCICVRVCVYVCECVYLCIWCICVCVCVYICIHMYVRACVPARVCVCVCMYVCLRAASVPYGGSRLGGPIGAVVAGSCAATQCQIQATSATYTTAHGSTGSLTH